MQKKKRGQRGPDKQPRTRAKTKPETRTKTFRFDAELLDEAEQLYGRGLNSEMSSQLKKSVTKAKKLTRPAPKKPKK